MFKNFFDNKRNYFILASLFIILSVITYMVVDAYLGVIVVDPNSSKSGNEFLIEKEYIINVGPAESNEKAKNIALTFDDGPDNIITPLILDILKTNDVKATFFVRGDMVKNFPDVLKRIYEEGHTIGNHTWNHPQFNKISSTSIEKQILDTDHIIKECIGVRPLLFRPPFGQQNSRSEKIIKKLGLFNIMWTSDTRDWTGRSASAIVDTVKREATPNGIILQHNSGQHLHETAAALPYIIKHLKSQGYTLVSVDQIIQCDPYQSHGQNADPMLID